MTGTVGRCFLFLAAFSFLKRKSLIYYQSDSAKAEPTEDPSLPAEIRSRQPKNQANQRAGRERKAEDTIKPFPG
jgi:hypothetical protein